MERERQRKYKKPGRRRLPRAVSLPIVIPAAVLAAAMAVSGFCFAATAPFAAMVRLPAEGTAEQYRVELFPVTDGEDTGASGETGTGTGTGGSGNTGNPDTSEELEGISASYPAGTEFEIGIRVSGGNYAALQLYLTYDSSLVSYTGEAEAAQESSQLEVTEATVEESDSSGEASGGSDSGGPDSTKDASGETGEDNSGADGSTENSGDTAEGCLFVTLFGEELTDGSTAAVLTFEGTAEGEAVFGITAAQAAPQGEDLGNDAADWLAERQLTGCTVIIGEASEETGAVTVTLNDSYLSGTGAVFTGLMSGENRVTAEADGTCSFTLTHTEACVAAYSTDRGVTYTPLTATAVPGQENTYQYSVPVQEGVIVAATLRGDADLSGIVDIDDASAIARFRVNSISLNSLQQLISDADNNGQIDIDDASAVALKCVNRRIFEW